MRRAETGLPTYTCHSLTHFLARARTADGLSLLFVVFVVDVGVVIVATVPHTQSLPIAAQSADTRDITAAYQPQVWHARQGSHVVDIMTVIQLQRVYISQGPNVRDAFTDTPAKEVTSVMLSK